MIVTFGDRVLPVHRPFHESRAKHRCNFGAWGSGKSYTICDEAIGWALEQPGIRGLITRKTIPELRDTTEQVFAERVPPDLWMAGHLTRTGGHFDTFQFPNGSEILFRSIDDWRKHKSLNLGFIAWDEASEFDAETYNGMMSRLRQVDITPEARRLGYTHQITKTGSWLATNPEGHDWVWRMFHPDSPDVRPGSAAFFSTSLDNPYLSDDYLDDILSMPAPWIKRYVLCQFDDFAGRIYEEFGEQHIVPHPKWIRGERPLVWMGMDPGTAAPTAGLWCWVDAENNRLVAIDEYEESNLAADFHARNWRMMEGAQNMNVRWRVADPNAITQRSRETLNPLDRAYARLGFHFNMGASSEKVRIPQLGRLIHLNRFVVSQRCERTIDAIKNYQYQDLTPGQRSRGEEYTEKVLKRKTHLVECAQYIAGRMVPMVPHTNRPQRSDREWQTAEIWRDVKKDIQGKRDRVRQRHSDLGGIAV